MSSRRTLNESKTSSNPAKKFIEWKSNDKCFSYYDKAKGENIKISLPVKFQFLEHFHTVKGWNDASESGIFANEVKFISKEPFKVRSFKGGDIAEGLYRDIRSDIRDAGGKYYRSIYVLLDGEIVNLQLKGACVSAYSTFMEGYENQIESNFITVNEVLEQKKGATKYTTPVFQIGDGFNKTEMINADESYKIIADYYNGYSKAEEPEEPEEPEEDIVF